MNDWSAYDRPDGLDIAGLAGVLDDARLGGRTLPLPLSAELYLSLRQAYAVQQALTARRLARGERIVGWKLGYTSAAMRTQMGIAEPNHGPLTDVMLLRPGGGGGAEVPPTALQPRVEPEVALRLARPVPPGASTEQALACCDAAFAALEVVDSIWADYRFTLVDNTADGSSAAWVVLGPELPLTELDLLPVRLSVDGTAVASATGAAANGHPAASLGWLAAQLADRDRGLAPGDVVITGGLTAAHPLGRGHQVAATFGAHGQVAVRG